MKHPVKDITTQNSEFLTMKKKNLIIWNSIYSRKILWFRFSFITNRSQNYQLETQELLGYFCYVSCFLCSNLIHLSITEFWYILPEMVSLMHNMHFASRVFQVFGWKGTICAVDENLACTLHYIIYNVMYMVSRKAKKKVLERKEKYP